jgi:hypothetical protein
VGLEAPVKPSWSVPLGANVDPRWCTPEGEGRTSPGDCRLLPHVVDGVEAACFPDLYQALAGQVDQVITL